MATNKTQPTDASVEGFIAAVPDERRRKDVEAIDALMRRVTKAEPRMWGDSIVGYGETRVRSPATGREGEWFFAGFAPRKANLALYLNVGFGVSKDLLADLGKHKTGLGCLYITKLADVDIKVLEKVVAVSVKQMKSMTKDGVTTMGLPESGGS